MKLSDNWITENALDFEYKKYMLLAYLQDVESDFSASKIYPTFLDLMNHYKHISAIINTRERINSAKTDLKRIDFKNFKLEYEQRSDEYMMEYIAELVAFSQPMFSHYINEGKKLYDFVEKQINIEPVGVVPVRIDEGYLFAQDGRKAEVKAYQYQISIFESDNEMYRAIHTNYIDTYETSLTTNYIKMKQQIIKTHKDLPNPAVFLLRSDMEFPLDETFMPVAKRLAVKYISV